MRPLLLALLLVAPAIAQPPRPYVYRILTHEVVDGDTLRVELDLGFDLRLKMLARLDGVDAPEQSTPAGKAVTEWVRRWCKAHGPLTVESVARDKFAGRFVAVVYSREGRTLNEALIGARLVRPYEGGARLPWAPERLAEIERNAVELER